jgi:hypothetical protein
MAYGEGDAPEQGAGAGDHLDVSIGEWKERVQRLSKAAEAARLRAEKAGRELDVAEGVLTALVDARGRYFGVQPAGPKGAYPPARAHYPAGEGTYPDTGS